MSIATAIQNAQGKVADAYTAVSTKGGTLPATQDLSNLPIAINSIPTNSGSVEVISAQNSAMYLFSGTSHAKASQALNYTKPVTVTSGTYTLWSNAGTVWKLLVTINL